MEVSSIWSLWIGKYKGKTELRKQKNPKPPSKTVHTNWEALKGRLSKARSEISIQIVY